jgi:hypothetical protein
VNPRVGGSRPAGRRVPAEMRARHRFSVRTRRGPSAVARFGVVMTAALACAAGPGVARADGSELAGLADQIQAATWSGVSGTVAAQPSAQDLAQKITDATRAAVAGAVAEASPTTLIAGRGDSPKEAPRAAANQIPRARVHQKARPRPAAAAASPLLDAEPASPAEPEVRHIATPDRRERERERKPPETPGAARAPHGPSLPFDLPSIPVPFAVPSSAGAASGGGSPVPPLLVALAAVVLFFVREVVIRRVPPRRPARPRPIVLPTWRPG